MVTEALGTVPGVVVVTYGDMPLLRSQTLQQLASVHRAEGNGVTVLSARVPDPTGYGRIVRDEAGALARIVEHADATAAERAIDRSTPAAMPSTARCSRTRSSGWPPTTSRGRST